VLAVLALEVSAAAQSPAVDPRTPSDQVCKQSSKQPGDGTQNPDGW
jgi:hypothetical protein